MHPNTTRRTKTWVYGPMGWIGSVHCVKFRCDFMARTCALVALVQPVLHRVSCSNKTLLKTPKHCETHQNMCLWSNGVDRVRTLRKIPKRFHGTNLSINCTGSTRLHRVCVVTKHCQIYPNTRDTHKHEFRVQWGGLGAFVAKNSDATSWHELLH